MQPFDKLRAGETSDPSEIAKDFTGQGRATRKEESTEGDLSVFVASKA